LIIIFTPDILNFEFTTKIKTRKRGACHEKANEDMASTKNMKHILKQCNTYIRANENNFQNFQVAFLVLLELELMESELNIYNDF
jgi:hypothetical protein